MFSGVRMPRPARRRACHLKALAHLKVHAPHTRRARSTRDRPQQTHTSPARAGHAARRFVPLATAVPHPSHRGWATAGPSSPRKGRLAPRFQPRCRRASRHTLPVKGRVQLTCESWSTLRHLPCRPREHPGTAGPRAALRVAATALSRAPPVTILTVPITSEDQPMRQPRGRLFILSSSRCRAGRGRRHLSAPHLRHVFDRPLR